MDFTLPPEHDDLRMRVRRFITDEVLPLEADRSNFNEYENIRTDVLERVRVKARAAGLWAPQMSTELGGLGLPMAGQAPFYEEANRSIFGPPALNCSAPDDGNMRLLSMVATKAQKDRWLMPIISGDVRSCFVMTEPHPGGGSDPQMIRTTAKKSGDKWVIHGHKWFSSGALLAKHFILVARTSDDPRKGLTAFLFHRDDPGWEIVRRISILSPEEHGGVGELKFDGLEIPDENRLMEIGDGLKLCQIRLGPARLTHCMRWLGLAKRSMEIAHEYVETREGFGIKLIDRESVQLKFGRIAHDIQIGRLLVMHAAWKLDQGDYARQEVSMAKVHVADTLHRACDEAIQLCGAKGFSKDTVLEWIYRYARAARLVDGASEVHNMVLAKGYGAKKHDFWSWGV